MEKTAESTASSNQSKSSAPLVSIIMPAYNCAAFIGESINSVLAQTMDDWELLVVDDCSNDTTVQVAESFRDHRIKIFVNQENHGAAYCRNLALREARGKYIAFLDGDDLWHPEKLSKQTAFMKNNDHHFSCTFYEEHRESGNSFLVLAPNRITKKMMRRCSYVGCLTVMWERDVIGPIQINEGIKKRNDYAMWLHAIEKADCFCLPEPLATYRVRENSISHVSKLSLLKSHKALYSLEFHYGFFRSWFCALKNAFFYIKKREKWTKNQIA